MDKTFLIAQLEVAHSAPAVARFVKLGAPAPSLEREVRACGGGVAIVDDGNPRAD